MKPHHSVKFRKFSAKITEHCRNKFKCADFGENYTKIMGAFGEVTTKELARLVSNLNEVRFVEEVSGVNVIKELK